MNFKDLLDRYLKLPEAQRLLIVGGVLLIVFVLFIYFSYLPARAQLTKIRNNLSKKITEMNEKKRIASQLDRYKQEVENLKRQLEIAKKILPEKAEIAELIKLIAQRASESGVSILSIEPKGVTPKGFYKELSFKINAEGAYHDIATFFDNISRVERIMSVKDFEIQPSRQNVSRKKAKEGRVLKLTAKFNLITYMFVQSTSPQKTMPIRRR